MVAPHETIKQLRLLARLTVHAIASSLRIRRAMVTLCLGAVHVDPERKRKKKKDGNNIEYAIFLHQKRINNSHKPCG